MLFHEAMLLYCVTCSALAYTPATTIRTSNPVGFFNVVAIGTGSDPALATPSDSRISPRPLRFPFKTGSYVMFDAMKSFRHSSNPAQMFVDVPRIHRLNPLPSCVGSGYDNSNAAPLPPYSNTACPSSVQSEMTPPVAPNATIATRAIDLAAEYCAIAVASRYAKQI